jgi:hypothetical protein
MSAWVWIKLIELCKLAGVYNIQTIWARLAHRLSWLTDCLGSLAHWLTGSLIEQQGAIWTLHGLSQPYLIYKDIPNHFFISTNKQATYTTVLPTTLRITYSSLLSTKI